MTKARKLAVQKISVKEIKATGNELDDLREFAAEAELVGQLQKQPGWAIIERDFEQYRSQIGSTIAYLDPKSKDYYDSKILFIAVDKLLSLFSDYAENRKRYLELLERIDNPKENIILDVDN